MEPRCVPAAAGRTAAVEREERPIEDAELTRSVEYGSLGVGLEFRVTRERFRGGNTHLYVRLEALEDVELEGLELPRLEGVPAEKRRGGRWVELGELGVVIKKPPWHSRWNDVGAYGHAVLGGATAVVANGVLALAVPGRVSLAAGDTVESALFLCSGGDAESEGSYGPEEARYVPEGEYVHSLVWECEEVWLGPPIFEGCPQRPYDQLITRPLGLDVLARKRFTWNNEDFALWRITGKARYRESGIKKAYALLATQNEHGGWFEGIEFYNLPPRHHHMYDTYLAGLFLLEAYDETGSERFLEAARRAKDFWLSRPPPANGHTEEGLEAWWYRWGGYVNEFGYTDERRVLNTHAGATAFLALLHERTGDEEARRGLEYGINAFKWGLERGIQKASGQFLYCLSQIDPTLERPGDPPYLRLDLVPQIEDVYTVASSYRMMLANRIARDPVVTAAVRRALDYWWSGYREGRVYTYRAYATIAYALAAGEIDLVYALALPELLKDPNHFTSMQRGLSSFVAPAGRPGLRVEVENFVEPVFLRRGHDDFLFALVNTEYPQRGLPVAVELPDGARADGVRMIEPATGEETELALEEDAGLARFRAPELGEFGVACFRLALAPL
jgi:hypothetical protein